MLAMVTLVASGLIATAPALGHDRVIDQSPKRGETVAAGVIEIRLTFNNELLAVSGASVGEILVFGPIGEGEALRNNSCAFISESGRDLTTRVDLDRPGDYRVTWRAVSSDGHPISESFNFRLINETGHVSAGLVPGTECDTAIDGATFDNPSADEENGYWLLWLALPVAAILLYLLLRPKAKPKN